MILAAACFVNVSGGSLQRRTRPHLEKISIESAPVKGSRALAAAVQFDDVLAADDSVSHDSKLAYRLCDLPIRSLSRDKADEMQVDIKLLGRLRHRALTAICRSLVGLLEE